MKKGLIIVLTVIIIIIVVGGYFFFIREESEEGETPKTEIRIKSGSTEMVIAPSKGKVIKDIVTISMEEVPVGTELVAFGIQGPGIEDMNIVGPNLGMDNDESDGWSQGFDTSIYPNNVYSIYSSTYASNELREGVAPKSFVQVQVTINNSAT